MKLTTLDERPDLIERFCQLGLDLLAPEDRAFALKPPYVQKILGLKFPVPSEAFFFEDETGEYFGRILLQGSVLDPELGHFGLFALSPEPKHQEGFMKLWPAIEKWFSYYGIKKIVGPYLYTTYFPYRFRSDSLPERYAWEPNQPAMDLSLFTGTGFTTQETYFSNFIENGLGVFETKGEREYEAALEQGIRFRPITQDSVETDVKIIFELSMQGFTDNALFAAIPFELFKSIYVPSFQTVDLRLSCIQEDAAGNPIGFNFTFVMDEQIIIKSVCVATAFRGKGLLNAGIRHSVVKAREFYPQVNKIVTALIHEDNGPSKHVANQMQDKKRHEYVLLSKDVP